MAWLYPLAHPSPTGIPTSSSPTTENKKSMIQCKWNNLVWKARQVFISPYKSETIRWELYLVFFFSYLWCCFVVFIEIHGFALLIMRHIPVRSGVVLLFLLKTLRLCIVDLRHIPVRSYPWEICFLVCLVWMQVMVLIVFVVFIQCLRTVQWLLENGRQ